MTDLQIKYRLATIEVLEGLELRRFNKEMLEDIFSNHFGVSIILAEEEKDDHDVSDWSFIGSHQDEGLYFDFTIFYLKMRKKGFDGSDLFITEVSWDF